MRTMNLDTLVSVGQRPWRPVAGAEDVDVWDKFDFPTLGTFRLGPDLIIFTLITTAGMRSLWAYVPVPAGLQKIVTETRFESDTEFDAFLAACFADREAVFAAAENFIITAKSDGVRIGTDRHALLAAAARWYIARVSARMSHPVSAEPDALLLATQGVIAASPV